MTELEYINYKGVLELYPFTTGQLRFLLNNRHKNGLNSTVRKIGKRLYFHKALLKAWFESQAEKGGRS